ncbi:hypothetical protein EUTSA_v10000564mg [Eutrema salsugineum]|uniref:Kinesin motor domain-containing protein n=1 Tax=Eutrema salsugineum TaxID=72664 RepID=V4L7D4_EUTSA|nr:hypothetical protein EUTSA_v10000564mg [Eutrema salsugineum]
MKIFQYLFQDVEEPLIGPNLEGEQEDDNDVYEPDMDFHRFGNRVAEFSELITVPFLPMRYAREREEYQRGDEIAWYPDADKMVSNEYNPFTAYEFVFGPQATTIEVYDVAAKPVVKAAMEGVNGTVFAYGVTSSGKTHTMHNRRPFYLETKITDAEPHLSFHPPSSPASISVAMVVFYGADMQKLHRLVHRIYR